LVGDKISFSNEVANFATNFHSRGNRNSNFENFISMASHYGSNRGVLPPNFDIQRHINLTEKSLSNPQNPKNESKSDYAHMVPKTDFKQCRNGSIEDTGKPQNSHSPLMTKRKQKGGNSTVRTKYAHHKNTSKLVSLNSNLRQPQKQKEEAKSSERYFSSNSRPRLGKLSADANSKVHLKEKLEFKEEIPNRRGVDKNNLVWAGKASTEHHLRSLEDRTDTCSILPTSTISSNCRKGLQSRKSSRNSRNRSSSGNNKLSKKFIITKAKKGAKSKNLMKLEWYKIPIGEDAIKFRELSGSRNKGRGQNSAMNKFDHNPYPIQFFSSKNDMFNHQMKGDSWKQYKHMKSNSEAVHKLNQDFEESKNDSGIQGRIVKKGLQLKNYSPEKKIPHIFTKEDNNDQNMIIFSNDFNTVKYSQSPFLNKLTNLKQKLSKKDKAEIKYGKGHKSRNSMFPKSYTENSKIQRRENDVYTKLSLKHRVFDRIPEEPIIKQFDQNRHHNPYTNIEVEHEVSILNNFRSFLHMEMNKQALMKM
jgi:hypothetical protein